VHTKRRYRSAFYSNADKFRNLSTIDVEGFAESLSTFIANAMNFMYVDRQYLYGVFE
jgi:hypothetical protein